MQLHHLFEHLLGLVICAVNVSIVLAESSSSHETGEGSRCFVTVYLAVLGNSQGEISVGAGLRQIDVVMVRTVHGAEYVLLTININGIVHRVGIVRKMA
jgi:hypothetical protein